MFPYPSGAGCTSAISRATRRPTSSRATSACAASTCCTRWAGTRSACRPSSTRSRPACIRRITTRAQHRRLPRQMKRSASPTTGSARSTPPIPTTTAGRSGSSCKLFERGLAYVAEVPVNWCPELGTVLANEEVIDGKSEVGGFPVHPPADAAVGAEDHRLRRRAARGPRRRSTGRTARRRCSATGSAAATGAEVDFAVDGARRARVARSSPRGPTRCSARPTWCSRRSIRSCDARDAPEQRAAVDAYREAAARKSDLQRRSWRRRRPASSPAATRSIR